MGKSVAWDNWVELGNCGPLEGDTPPSNPGLEGGAALGKREHVQEVVEEVCGKCMQRENREVPYFLDQTPRLLFISFC